jgi:hypothetical protein
LTLASAHAASAQTADEVIEKSSLAGDPGARRV